MNRYIKVLFIALLITGCEKETPQLKNKVNEIFKVEAGNIFGSSLENERSYSSYSSYSVIYIIDGEKLSLSDFHNFKIKDIEKRGWKFKKKLEQSYIFCKGNDQLEIVPPRKNVKNKILTDGDLATQLEDQWVVLFLKIKSKRLITCNKSN